MKEIMQAITRAPLSWWPAARIENKPISRQAIDQMLKKLAKDLGLGMRIATHTLRKTFCLHQMVMSGNEIAFAAKKPNMI